MSKNRMTRMLLVALAATMLFGCAAGEEPAEEPQDMIELTLEELSEYDGQDGSKAYVAVDGEIYDVTDSALWKMGMHNGFQAGQDLTDAIKNESPHGVGNLQRVPKIGIIVE